MSWPTDQDESGYTRREVLLKGGVLGAAIVVGGIGTRAASAFEYASPTRGGTLRLLVSQGGLSDTLDPALTATDPEYYGNGAIYDTLTRLAAGFVPEPGLATSWKASADAKTWTFTLRRGVKFHDGRDFTASDVVYSIRRLLDKKLGSPLYSRLTPILTTGGIRAADSHTVVVHLKHADSFLPVALGLLPASIVPANTTSFAKPVGTGPFVFKSFVPVQSFEVTRNEHYWEPGKPYLDGIRCFSFTDVASAIQSITAGQADVVDKLPLTLASKLEGRNGLKLLRHREARFDNLVLDASKDPFTDVRVREAFKLSLNRPKIVSKVYGGFASVGNDLPVPTDDPFYPKGIKQTNLQIDRAKQLMADAGFSSGLDLTLYTTNDVPSMADLAVFAVGALADIGVRVKVNERPGADFWDQVWLKQNFYVSTWVRRHVADILSIMFGSAAPWNESHYVDPTFERLVSLAKATPVPSQQRKYFAQAMQRVQAQSGFICPDFYDDLYAYRPNVVGLRTNDATQLELRSISLKRS